MDQQSAYARMDFVEGKFREHDKRYTEDMNVIKASFDTLSERVIKLEAVVESLQKMFVMNQCTAVGTTKTSQKRKDDVLDSKWVDLKVLFNMLKANGCESIQYYLFNRMLIKYNIVTRSRCADGSYYNYSVTEYGASLELVRLSTDHFGRKLLYNSEKVSEFCELIKRYNHWIETPESE